MGERGSATMYAVAMLGLLMSVTLASAAVIGLVRSHRVAQSAADLSALAGASALQQASDPCAVAARLARTNQAVLAECHIEGAEVWVEVSVEGPRWLGRSPDLHARARAGPGLP